MDKTRALAQFEYFNDEISQHRICFSVHDTTSRDFPCPPPSPLPPPRHKNNANFEQPPFHTVNYDSTYARKISPLNHKDILQHPWKIFKCFTSSEIVWLIYIEKLENPTLNDLVFWENFAITSKRFVKIDIFSQRKFENIYRTGYVLSKIVHEKYSSGQFGQYMCLALK